MRFIPTRIHGMMDYAIGLLLIAAPWLLGFGQGGAETWVPVILGAGVIAYSLMTDYELGYARMIGMRTHLALDGVGGAFLLISPWLFGFADQVWIPHVVIGLLEMGAAFCTEQIPYKGRRRAHT